MPYPPYLDQALGLARPVEDLVAAGGRQATRTAGPLEDVAVDFMSEYGDVFEELAK